VHEQEEPLRPAVVSGLLLVISRDQSTTGDRIHLAVVVAMLRSV
jgi:hypothetical protein